MDKITHLKNIILISCLGFSVGGLAYADTEVTPAPSTNTTVIPTGNAEATISDPSLQTAIQSALNSFKDKVNVTVMNGVVNLSGQLDSDTDYEKVVTITESTPGVIDINVDNLSVKDSQSPLTDTFITAKVKGELLKSDIMGEDIPSWSVSVETKDGQVFLSGTIGSEQEKQSIINLIKGVKGVAKINDEIEVSGKPTAENTSL